MLTGCEAFRPSDLILRSPSEARASRRMAASPNLLPWFETARIAAKCTQAAPAMARLLTMRPSLLERNTHAQEPTCPKGEAGVSKHRTSAIADLRTKRCRSRINPRSVAAPSFETPALRRAPQDEVGVMERFAADQHEAGAAPRLSADTPGRTARTGSSFRTGPACIRRSPDRCRFGRACAGSAPRPSGGARR